MIFYIGNRPHRLGFLSLLCLVLMLNDLIVAVGLSLLLIWRLRSFFLKRLHSTFGWLKFRWAQDPNLIPTWFRKYSFQVISFTINFDFDFNLWLEKEKLIFLYKTKLKNLCDLLVQRIKIHFFPSHGCTFLHKNIKRLVCKKNIIFGIIN